MSGHARLWAIRGVVLLGSGGLASSCGPSTAPVGPHGQGQCHAEPDPTPPVALPPLRSRVGLSVSVEEKALLERLAQQVPSTVAKAKNQSIGAPGRVTYTITRSPFTLQTSDEELTLSTHLRGDIDVCKPLGPFCAEYGSCKPQWDVNVTFPTDFTADPELRAKTRVELSKGCVLQPVGFNATDELERITRGEARKVRDRINGELSRINRDIQRAWQDLTAPQELHDTCLRMRAERARYSPPLSDGKTLTTSLELEGWIERGCDGAPSSSDAEGSPLPKLEREPKLSPEIALRTDIEWELAAVQGAATAALGAPVELAISGPSAQYSAGAAASNRLWLKAGSSTCPQWVEAVPRMELGKLYLDAAQGAELDPKLRALRLTPPKAHASVAQGIRDLDRQQRRAEREARARGFELTLVVEPSESARVGEKGILLGTALHGTARASLSEPTKK